MCSVAGVHVLYNIPGWHSNAPPLRVSDVLVLHSNNDRLCRGDGSLSSVRRERERELYNTFSHEPQFLVPGNSVRGRPLSVLWLSDSSLSLSPWCPWRSGMKRDTTRSPCGLFEYFNWVASAAASKLNYPHYLF